jgi:drug/metabolite transporter (DMT)-like permease
MKYFLVFMGVVFAVTAQVLLKYASLSASMSRKWLIFIGFSAISYAIAFIFQTYIYKYFPLSKIAPTLSTAIVLFVIFMGVWLFNETLQTKQIIGILLGAVSIYLIMG